MDTLSSHRALHAGFELAGGNADAVVFLHGILGSPLRFRRLAEALHARGFDCYSPLLPGHGGTAREFRKAPRGSFEACAKACVRGAWQTHKRTFVVGYSLGGVIALDCALDGLACGVALLNTPVRVRVNFRQVLGSMRAMAAPENPGDEARARYRERNSILGANFLQYPLWLGQYLHMYRYLRRVRRRLGEVRARVLAAQSALDEAIDRGSMARLRAGLARAEVRVLRLGDSGHGCFSEEDEALLLDAMLEFMRPYRA